MKAPIIIILLLPTLLFCQTKSEDEIPTYNIVVSANLNETSAEKVGSSVTLITAEQIKKLQARTVAEVLQFVPGLEISSAGPLGGTTSVFIRGAKSEQTLLLIDGVEMNDTISVARGVDFAHIPTDNIERIEIIRGPQSVIHGSDAIGGVVNIITKDKTDSQSKLSLDLSYGSNNKKDFSFGVLLLT